MAGKSKKKALGENNTIDSVDSFRNKIISVLLKIGKKNSIPLDALESKCLVNKGNKSNFVEALAQLKMGDIVQVRKLKKVMLNPYLNLNVGEITRVANSFGYAITKKGREYFIPGVFMLGAMPGDQVLISDIKSRTGDPEGEVLYIINYGSSVLTGRIVEEYDGLYFAPDIANRTRMMIVKSESVPFVSGDKVQAEVIARGRQFSWHKVKITSVFGSGELAASCAKAILSINGAPGAFSAEVQKEAKKISEGGVQEFSLNNREDLRKLSIFTIDSAESKDLDDAISISKNDKGYLLGVHIADVSHYVKGNSELDKEAMNRGTSIYYADKVIPMLPKELSNGICSLNPDEDRLTLSVFIDLSEEGEILSYRFCKSVIRSRVKGIYSEINKLLSGTADSELTEKYSSVADELPLMDNLADLLIAKRQKRHAPELETTECKLIINEDGMCCDVQPRERGKSERIIEEFMLTANEAAAKLAKEKNVPFVYRVHEIPPKEKTVAMRDALNRMKVSYPKFKELKPVHAAEILDSVRGTDKFELVNTIVLRSMAKARYSEEPLGHFGLALDDYAHFTSPIRRYPDLAIHRIITDILAGYDEESLSKRYGDFVVKASDTSSEAEVRAMTIERDCEECYKAEYMRQHLGESFTAKISGVKEYGFFVKLSNTIEGLVHISTLPEGEYDYTMPFKLTEEFSGKSYQLGDKVQVLCAAVSVSDGTIDFVLDDEE